MGKDALVNQMMRGNLSEKMEFFEKYGLLDLLKKPEEVMKEPTED